jgi:ABC-2 type transport system permease protein
VTDWLVSVAPSAVVSVVRSIGVMTHFQGFEKGVIDLRDVVYFLSVIGFALFCNGVIIRNLRAG